MTKQIKLIIITLLTLGVCSPCYSKLDVGFLSFNAFVESDTAQALRDNNIVIAAISFPQAENDPLNEAGEVANIVNTLQGGEASIDGPALIYPNPFSVSTSTAFGSGGTLGYKLTANMDIELRLYDMRGNEISKKTFNSGSQGGALGYNHVRLTPEDLSLKSLPAGPYYIVLIYENNVLAKTKFVVIP